MTEIYTPRFKYGNYVRVKSGFHEGQTGKVIRNVGGYYLVDSGFIFPDSKWIYEGELIELIRKELSNWQLLLLLVFISLMLLVVAFIPSLVNWIILN